MRRRMVQALRRHRLTLGTAATVLAVLAGCVTAPSPTPVSGSDQRPLPHRTFSPSSFWYRTLPDAVPLDTASDEMISRIVEAAPEPGFDRLSRGSPQMAINTTEYTPPVYVARNSDPVVTFEWHDCQRKGSDMGLVAKNLTGIHVPFDARPSPGTDAEMVLYNVDTGTYTDTWQTRTNGRTWSACWGGTIRDARKNPGVFTPPFGTTATGLPLEPGIIRAAELQRGKIDHVVGIVLPRRAVSVEPAAPATRTDGTADSGAAVAAGQLLRLPADLDLDGLRLSESGRVLAEAAQRYGFIVWDTGAGIAFRAENAQAFRRDPYPAVFNGEHPALALWGDPARGEQPFPFDKLEVVRRDHICRVAPSACRTQ